MQPFLRFFIICIIFFNPLIAGAQPLVVNFTANNTSSCTPFLTQFTDATTGGSGSYTYSWSYVYPSGSGAAPVSFPGSSIAFNTFTDTGYYDIIETVTSGTVTASRTDTALIHAYQSNVTFTTTHPATDTTLKCPHTVITFSNTTTNIGCADTFRWYFTNTTIDSPLQAFTIGAAPLTYTFTVPGVYNVSLYEPVSTYCGCTGSVIYYNYIKIDSTPTACFSLTPTSPCGPSDTVYFNSSCSVNAVRFHWVFGDGDTSDLPNPGHVFPRSIPYTNYLTVYSTANCANTAPPQNVYIGNFVPAFSAYYGLPVCTKVGAPTVFVDHTPGSTEWAWHDESGVVYSAGTNYYPSPDLSGVHTITDSAWNPTTGCTGLVSHTFTLYPTPVFTSFTATPAYRCTPDLTSTFSSVITDYNGGISQRLWVFGESASGHNDTAYSDSVHIYTTSGTFRPTLYVTDVVGCSNADSNLFINVRAPSFSIVPKYDSGCAPFMFSDTTYISRYNGFNISYTVNSVNFGDGSPVYIPPAGVVTSTHTYTLGGVYIMSVTYTLPGSDGGCTYIATKSISVGSIHPTFTISATPDSVCPNTEVYFNSGCTNCTSFFWNLYTKNSTSNYDSNQYTANYPLDNRPIKIFGIADVNGCTDTEYKNIFILPPAASITDSVASCDNVNTIYFSSAGSTGATGYHWSFGDATSSTLSNPVHTYTVPSFGGSFEAVLVDTGRIHHCINRDSIPVNIYPIIDTFSTADTLVCINASVIFRGPVPQVAGLDTAYIWTFSNRDSTVTKTVYSDSIIYYFQDTGFYNVQLTVVNEFGCSKTLIKNDYVYVRGPIGGLTSFTPVGCTPLSVNFMDNNSVPAGDSITSRQWQFSYPSTVSTVSSIPVPGYGRDTTYAYPKGTFILALTDSDIYHCYTRDTVTIRSEQPQAYFTANLTTSCAGVPVIFTDSNTHCTYSWNFGDGTTATTGPSVSHGYAANGTYSVSVAVTTTPSGYFPTGCVDTFVRTSYITIENIRVGFVLDPSSSLCPPLIGAANATGLVAGYTYYWELNNMPTDTTGTLFLYNLPDAGTYTVTLIDSNAVGCKDTASQLAVVNGPGGVITVTPDSGCVPLTVHMHFTDTNGTSTVPTYIWVTGDDSVANVDTPGLVHTYLNAGSYLPYIYLASGGCSAVKKSATDSVRVFPVPVVTVDHPGLICYGTDTILAAGGGIPGDTYSWSGSYGLNCTTCANVVASPTVTTTYTVTMSTIHGCTDTAITTVTVDTELIVHVSGYDSVCLGVCDTLIAYGANGNYQWNPDTALSTGGGTTVIACPTSTRVYTVVVTDNKGCAASQIFTVTVNPLPDITVSPVDAHVCRGDSTHLFATGAGIDGTYVWSPDQFIDNTTIADPYVYDTADFQYKIVGTTIYGCKDSDIVEKITVYDTALLTISNDTTICQGRTVQLKATSTSDSLASYLWQPSAGLSDSVISDPYATPDTTTAYTVRIRENVCFTRYREVTVYVIPTPEILLPASSTIIAGSSVQLAAVVGNSANVTTWAWAPAATLSCDTCYNPIATPTTSTTYTVTGTTPIGCTSENSVQVNIMCVEASQVFVPNTFTPNGDGVNDRFYLSGKGLGLITRMSIYNRWGEKVFEAENINANDPGAGWDGTYKGIVVEPGVFVYVFELLCETGVPFTLKGDISIVR